MSKLEKDYPKLEKRAVNCPYLPYADDFSQEQHQYGPFQPIKAAQKKKEAARQLDQLFRRLQVDMIDPVKHHEVLRYEDPHPGSHPGSLMLKGTMVRSWRLGKHENSAISVSRAWI